jgi:polygalacturonase
MPYLIRFSLPLVLLSLGLAGLASAQDTAPTPTADPKAPAPKHFLITDYGAKADGTTLNSAAIQKTIDTAATAGGGVVEIPKGTFLSGSIFLKPGVDLFLDEGAVLLGSQNISDYPKQTTRIEGHFQPWRMALVNVQSMDHVRIGGTGQLNGNGAPFWAAFRSAPRGTTNLDVERPRLMFVDHCADVRIEDIALQDSGFWNIHLYHCHDVLLQGLRINAPAGSPSTDGVDVDSCQNITIRKCEISNNDDDIALKGSKGPFADKDTDSPPVENILIEDCTFGSGNGVLTCGSEATIVRNVTVRNCVINGGANLLTLKLRPDTPQHYSNITIDGITATGAGRFLNVAPWTQYFDLQGQPSPARVIDHVTARNVTGSFRLLGSLRGTVGDSISNITLENINLAVPTTNFTLGPTENVVLKNVAVNGAWYQLPAAGPAAALPRARAPATTSPAAAAPVAAPAATANS